MAKQQLINTDSVFIGGIEYVPKTSAKELEVSTDGLPFVIIRTYSAGVHFGYLKQKESTLAGMEVKLIRAQRMRSWAGAMDLSQLAIEGSTKPDQCKPSVIVNEIHLVAIEIINVSVESFKQLTGMKIWKV
jgi:hypothetical protein